MSAIDDPSIARAILDKVNQMNVETGVKVILPVALFALLPSSTSQLIAFFVFLGTVLYTLRDKLPEEKA
jgi:hypothetical protein